MFIFVHGLLICTVFKLLVKLIYISATWLQKRKRELPDYNLGMWSRGNEIDSFFLFLDGLIV